LADLPIAYVKFCR